MAGPSHETKVIEPFMPKLFHCASAKVAIQLRKEFGLETLRKAFGEIQQGNVTVSKECREKFQRAKAMLIDIPPHLRGTVMEAVNGSCVTVAYWIWYYAFYFRFEEAQHTFQFRSDGTVDAVKTAQVLVKNEKLDIRQRFKLACVFCLEESVNELWVEMEASGQTIGFEMSNLFIVNFWVEWLRERPDIPISQSLGTLVINYSHVFDNSKALVPRLSTFFPLLRPEDRQKCLHLLDKISSFDDLLCCLYAITNKEQEQILTTGLAFKLLRNHLLWPLQTMFLPLAAKLWDYIDDSSFHKLLDIILVMKAKLKDFNYAELLERFWDTSPLHLKVSARAVPELRQKIDSFFDEKKKKRKHADD